MIRPCFLVVDREYPGSISTRKLVIETAKLNVLTAYSGKEAIAMLKRFPAVNGIVLDVGLEDLSCADVIRSFKTAQPKLPVIAISAPGFEQCVGADFHLESFEPAKLLEILRKLEPEVTAAIERENEKLSRQQGAS